MMGFLFLLQIAFHVAGGTLGFLFKRNAEAVNRFTHTSAVLGGISGAIYSLWALLQKGNLNIKIPVSLPFGDIQFTVDSLCALFVFLISLLTIAASIFAIGYTREYQGKKSIPLLGFFYNFFILAMILVVTVRNAFWFLIFWEVMSLTSYFLVIFEHEKPQAVKAGTLYLVMTHIGTAFIAAAFWCLYIHSGSFSFESFQLNASTLAPAAKNAIFFCALIGFGTKAGIIPLHIWLPQAHPQAPSHVSALMSGVMIKTAVYMLLRFLFNFMGDIPGWWGTIVLMAGILSALVGILYALMEQDLKRLLAFSSIENIGIIFLGIGMALVFASAKQPVHASFALMAALYHTVNHAMFKGLLFLGAGSILSSTHTRNIEELGGLIKKMPVTAVYFLIGAVAISALPPLNGFVSEWLTFISLLLGFECQGIAIRFFSPVLAALLGFAGALAATCFIKAFGIGFLGNARSPHAEHAHEGSFSMKSGMGLLAVSCFGLSFAAPWVISVLGNVTKTLGNVDPNAAVWTRKLFLVTPIGAGSFSPLLIGVILIVFVLTLMISLRVAFGKQSTRIAPSWDCGMPTLTPRMQYTAIGYSKPLRRILSFFYQPLRRVQLEDEGHEMLRTAQHFESGITHLFDEWIYQPLTRAVSNLSQRAKQIQTGHIQLYLSYIFVTLILLLLFGVRS